MFCNTKGFFSSGERMAIVVAWNPEFLATVGSHQMMLLIHPPTSRQYAYTKAMESLTERDLKNLASHYESQVRNDDVDIGFHLLAEYGMAFMPMSLF